MRTRKTLTILVITTSIVGLLGYVFIQARPFVSGPHITTLSPENGTTTTQTHVIIKGIASRITHLSINNRKIAVSGDGTFTEEFIPAPGYNIIEIKGRDRFGREATRHVAIVRR